MVGRVASRLSPGVFVGTTGVEIYGALRGSGNWAQRVSKALVVGTFNTGAYVAGAAVAGVAFSSIYGVAGVGVGVYGIGAGANFLKERSLSFIDRGFK